MRKIHLIKDSLFKGIVSHVRYKPFFHKFNYKFSYFWFSIKDEKKLKFFKKNKFSLFSFYDEDHGPLEKKVRISDFLENKTKKVGLRNIYQIKVFCLPRMLGYVFNPISVFVCFNKKGSPKAIMYQVGNTFNERYFYVCKVEKTNFIKKKFYVSPYFRVQGNYLISFSIDKDFVNLFIVYKIKNKKVFEASFNGKSMDMDDKNLLICFFSNMFQTFKVTLTIYIEALKLYFKGARYIGRPKKPKISLQ